MKTISTVAVVFALFASLSAASPVKRNAVLSFDDSSPSIHYYPSSKWHHLTGLGSTYMAGTESYSDNVGDAYYTFTGYNLPFGISAAKKADRGLFIVFANDVYVGTGDAHGTCTGNNCPSVEVFAGNATGLGNGGAVNITVRNVAYDQRINGTPYLGFDAAFFYSIHQ